MAGDRVQEVKQTAGYRPKAVIWGHWRKEWEALVCLEVKYEVEYDYMASFEVYAESFKG